LIEEPDIKWVDKRIDDELKYFQTSMNELCPESPLFGDFMNPMEVYENFGLWETVRDFLVKKLNDYNSTASVVRMDLILFREAVQHVVRIIRAIGLGHLLIAGLAGSGRQSLCKLAAFIAEMGIFQIKPTEKYKLMDFREDLKTLYKLTGIKGKSTIFLLSDHQLKDELFYEIINNILSTGEVTNLFKSDELEELKVDLIKRDPTLKNLQSLEEVTSAIFDRSKMNLHIVMLMSPGKAFGNKVQQYPALISCTTIDWFCEWTEEAYFEVSKAYFANLKVEDSQEVKQEDAKSVSST
jgi:dynein heavy chain